MISLFAAADGIGAGLWPFAVLLISVVLIIGLITLLRVHAFLALILAAFTAGLLSTPGSLPGEPQKSHWVQAVELTTIEFGSTAGKIGVVIALASVISMCLMESGAADKIVRRFLAVFGPKRAGAALVTSSYIISIPIFFDTFFMLLLPIARVLRLRTGKDYLLYVMAICCAGCVTHSMVAPHPGPLAMAELLKIDLGITIAAGLVAGVVPVFISWMTARWINTRMEIPLRDAGGFVAADLKDDIGRPESELPSFTVSILPIILPIVLISFASFSAAFGLQNSHPVLYQWIEFAGNRNVALLVGTMLAMWVLARQKGYSIARICALIGPPFETAGVIILITSAGGAFGLMLKHAGVGEAIKALAAGHEVNYVFMAWLVACVIRIAQGSATVSMLTTATMMLPMIGDGSTLPYHPIYIFLAIGFGAMVFSWMNDSGFWVVSKLSGFTEKETLKSWSVITTVNSVTGMAVSVLGSYLLPLKGF